MMGLFWATLLRRTYHLGRILDGMKYQKTTLTSAVRMMGCQFKPYVLCYFQNILHQGYQRILQLEVDWHLDLKPTL